MQPTQIVLLQILFRMVLKILLTVFLFSVDKIVDVLITLKELI